jgi:hypothetical protein
VPIKLWRRRETAQTHVKSFHVGWGAVPSNHFSVAHFPDPACWDFLLKKVSKHGNNHNRAQTIKWVVYNSFELVKWVSYRYKN